MAALAHDNVPACPSRSWRDLAAPVASAVCLVHCVGLALLAPILPAALALVAHDPWLERALWGSAAALSFWMLVRSRRLIPAALFVVWAVGTAIGVVALLKQTDTLQPVSLVLFGGVQLMAFARRFRAHHVDHQHSARAHEHPAHAPAPPSAAVGAGPHART